MTLNFDEIPKKALNVDHTYCSSLSKHVYVMLNHRAAYLCWMDSLRKGIIKSGAFLCHIDWHADFSLFSDSLLLEDDKIQDCQEKELEDFVRTKLSLRNCDFIALAMNRGVIGDAVSIDKEPNHDSTIGGHKKMGEKTTERKEFTDTKKRLHTFYFGGPSIIGLIGYRGLLTDTFDNQDVKRAFLENALKNNLILDIDLDYFTYHDSEGQWSLNDRNLKLILESDGFDFVLQSAKVITIALEPFYCGNALESLHVLKNLSEHLKRKLDIDIEKQVREKFKTELSS